MSRESAAREKSNAANHGAMRKIRATVIDLAEYRKNAFDADVEKANGLPGSGAEPGASQVEVKDPFQPLVDGGKTIAPPFDMLTLAMMGEHSSELSQCVEAMEINISGTGYRLVSRIKEGAEDEEMEGEELRLLEEMRAERAKLINFFTYSTEESFIAFRRKLTRDLEYTGNAYFEVVRNVKGEICSFHHIPSYQMRLGRLDEQPNKVKRRITEVQPDGSMKISTMQEYRRFRIYAQSRGASARSFARHDTRHIRWFKQFGDMRNLHKERGEFETEEKPVAKKMRATEVVHFSLYSPRTAYGLPRYIGNLLSIFGDRAAEEINYTTFRNNNIPSLIISVSNGELTQGTIDRINTFMESQIQGADNYSKALLIEAEPLGDEGEDGGQVKIQIERLTKDQIGDALFQNYSKENQDKIRRAFRLPPILVGRSSDMNRAVAETARQLADTQVFAPERLEFDSYFNRYVLPDMGIVYHKFESNTPNTTDNQQLVRILAGSEKTGGMTPFIAREILQEVFGRDLPPFPESFNPHLPFSLTMAEAVKATPPGGGEPGNQGQSGGADVVKTLKALGVLGGDDADDDFEVDIDVDTLKSVTNKLQSLQGAAEILWRLQGAGTSP